MAVGNNQRLDRALSGYRATIGKNEFDPWDASGARAAEYASRYGGSPSTMAYLADQQAAVEQAGNEQALRWQAQQDRGGFAGGVKRALPYAAMLATTAATGGLAGPTWLAALRAAPAAFGGLGAVTGNKTMRNIGTVAGLANLGYGLYGGGAGAAAQNAAGAATDTAGQAVGDIAMNGNRTTMGNLFQPRGNTVRSWAERLFPLPGATVDPRTAQGFGVTGNLLAKTPVNPFAGVLGGPTGVGTVADLAKPVVNEPLSGWGRWRNRAKTLGTFGKKAMGVLEKASESPALGALAQGLFQQKLNTDIMNAQLQQGDQAMRFMIAEALQNEELLAQKIARLTQPIQEGLSAGGQLASGTRTKYFDPTRPQTPVTDEAFTPPSGFTGSMTRAGGVMDDLNLRLGK